MYSCCENASGGGVVCSQAGVVTRESTVDESGGSARSSKVTVHLGANEVGGAFRLWVFCVGPAVVERRLQVRSGTLLAWARRFLVILCKGGPTGNGPTTRSQVKDCRCRSSYTEMDVAALCLFCLRVEGEGREDGRLVMAAMMAVGVIRENT